MIQKLPKLINESMNHAMDQSITRYVPCICRGMPYILDPSGFSWIESLHSRVTSQS